MAWRAEWPWFAAPLTLCVALGLLAGVSPPLAVAAAAGAAFAVLLTADLTLGLALFTIVAFAESAPAIAGSDVTIVKILGGLLALSWIATVATGRAGDRVFPSRHPGITAAMLVLIAWIVVGVGWAENGAAAGTDLQRFALNMLLVPIVFTAVRERQDLILIVAVCVAGAVLAAIVGIGTAADEGGLTRISGVAGTANELASLLVTGLLLAGGLALGLRRMPLARSAALAAMGVCLIGLFLTASRAGLVALIVALIAAIFLSGRWRVGALVVAVTIGLALTGYFAFVAPEPARERVTTLGDGTGRTDIWTVAWRMVEANPVTGVGAGNFKTSSIHYLIEPGTIRRDDFIIDTPQVAHNSYLHVLAELGIPGLALFVAIIVACLSCAWRAARRFAAAGDSVLETLARAIVLALIALLVADFFASDHLNKELWLLLGLGPALLAISQETLRARQASHAL
jgi:O-antigen ligase